MPNKPEDKKVKRVMDIARKASGDEEVKPKKKTEKAKSPDKVNPELLAGFERLLEEKLKGVGKLQQRVETLENTVKNTGSQETRGQGQGKGKGNELTPEQKLEEARKQKEEETKKAQSGQELTPEEYQKLPAEEKIKFLEQQLRASSSPQDWFGRLMQIINSLSPVVRTAMMRGGGSGGDNQPSPVGITVDQLKAFSGVETALMGHVVNIMKMLPKMTGVLPTPPTGRKDSIRDIE